MSGVGLEHRGGSAEAAEIRSMIARTAQLWTEVGQEEEKAAVDARRRSLPHPPDVEHIASIRRVSMSVQDAPAPQRAGDAAAADAGNSVETSEGDHCGPAVQEDTESDDSGEMAHADSFGQYQSRQASPLPADAGGARHPEAYNPSADSVRSDTDTEDAPTEGDYDDDEDGFESADDGSADLSNRDINLAKAEAVRNGILSSLHRLGFHPPLTNAGLEAGILEVEHYDADCELAYIDIFLSLMKMVCDAHLDVLGGDRSVGTAAWTAISSSDQLGLNTETADHFEEDESSSREHVLPFKWPVFDMAQFEFGNARVGTCFDSVCVLINLPKVPLDRSHELMELLSSNLFCMIGDPIQVVIPSMSSTGRTKGHAFLEFDDPAMARRCAAAVDGMTWGRGVYGRIRASMFRHYQVKPSSEGELSQRHSSRPASFPGTIEHERNRYVPDTLLDAGSGGYFHGEHGSRGLRRDGIFDEAGHYSDTYVQAGEASEARHQTHRLHQRAVGLPVDMANLLIGDDGEMLEAEGAFVDGRMQQFSLREIPDPHIVHGYELPFSSGEEGSEYDDSSSLSGDSVLELQTDEQSARAPVYPSIDDGFEGDNEEDDGEDAASALRARLVSLRHLHDRLREEGLVSFEGHAMGTEDQEGPYAEIYNPFGLEFAQGTHLDGTDYCDLQESGGADKPWRAYCSELVAQNREMQEQIAVARRRIVQLGHNNQKLHLLIDRIERDRDGLLFENDLLQNQLQGAEANERHHDSLLKELVMLRNRMKTSELMSPAGSGAVSSPRRRQYLLRMEREDSRHSIEPSRLRRTSAVLIDSNSSDLDAALSPSMLATASMDDLKEWERSLDAALARVRSAKEEKAAELQKKLDRQVEEQQELKLCVICLSNDKSILCLPCRHLCLCGACASRQEVDKCPICRLEIDEMIQVYA